MFKIAICDSDKKQQYDLLHFIAQDTDIEDDYSTECFSNVQEVRKRVQERDMNFDILFLMIDSDGTESISLVEDIRESNIDIDIIFLAENMDFLKDAFRCKAFNYIVKPLKFTTFQYEMQQYLAEKRKQQKDFLTVTIKGKEERIPLRFVQYFVSDARRIGAVLTNNDTEIWFYEKMDNLETMLLKYGFLRCHQSYLVNTRKINAVSNNGVKVMEENIPISRKYLQNVKEKWEKIKQKRDKNVNITDLTILKAKEKKEVFWSDDATIAATINIGKNYNKTKYGIIMGIRGECQNLSYRIYQGDEVFIGRDCKKCQIIVRDTKISRVHCSLKFDESTQCYYICDYSKNGTLLGTGERLEKEKWIRVEKDTTVQLIDSSCLFVLI